MTGLTLVSGLAVTAAELAMWGWFGPGVFLVSLGTVLGLLWLAVGAICWQVKQR